MILEPGGYLSPGLSQWPTPLADVTSSSVWWTPVRYNGAPCFDGVGSFEMVSPGQLQLDISACLANKIYNVALIRGQDGAPTLALTPAWSSLTDAGNAAFLADFAATWLPVNAAALTMFNGSTTYAVPAGQAVWLGTVCPAAAGSLTVHVGAGAGPRRRDIWNRWNQETVELIVSDPTFNWLYSSRHPAYANNNINNYVAPLTGKPQRVEARYQQVVASTNGTMAITGIQYDTEAYATGQLPQSYPGQTKPGAYKFKGSLGCAGRSIVDTLIAEVTIPDLYGAHSLRALHWIESYTDQFPGDRANDPNWFADFYGNEHSMRLTARYAA